MNEAPGARGGNGGSLAGSLWADLGGRRFGKILDQVYPYLEPQ